MDGVTAGWEDFERTPPHDVPAEQCALGGMLLSKDAISDVTEAIRPADHYRPAHQLVHEAILDLYGRGEPADAITVANELAGRGELARIGGAPYLHTLISSVPTAANAGYYARIVAGHAVRRRISEAGTRMVQRASSLDADPAEILAGAERDLAGAVSYSETGSTGLMDIAEFCSARYERGAVVIPGLLCALDRVIIVAGEGVGKSTLARQIWVMTAAGLHPFTGRAVPPKRTLYIDLENPPGIVQAKTRPLLDLGRQAPGWDSSRARIWAKPGGVDVRSAADQQMLGQVIRAAAPDLILAGPLYKMTVDQGERAEQIHGAVAAFWDRVRERHGCALWLEAHAPMAQGGPREMRPLGSGIWQRWPEFGISLHLVDRKKPSELKLGRFRGDRDERQWPEKIVRPSWGEQWKWPWSAIYPAETFTREPPHGERP